MNGMEKHKDVITLSLCQTHLSDPMPDNRYLGYEWNGLDELINYTRSFKLLYLRLCRLENTMVWLGC